MMHAGHCAGRGPAPPTCGGAEGAAVWRPCAVGDVHTAERGPWPVRHRRIDHAGRIQAVRCARLQQCSPARAELHSVQLSCVAPWLTRVCSPLRAGCRLTPSFLPTHPPCTPYMTTRSIQRCCRSCCWQQCCLAAEHPRTCQQWASTASMLKRSTPRARAGLLKCWIHIWAGNVCPSR